jgi:hypothetical protein
MIGEELSAALNGGSESPFGESRRRRRPRQPRDWSRMALGALLVPVRRDRRTVSARRWSSTAVAAWRRRHDLSGEGAPGRDNDQLPIAGAHREGTGVSLLKNAQDVGDRLAATLCGPAPPDHDPLADIGGGQPDL